MIQLFETTADIVIVFQFFYADAVMLADIL